MTSKSKSLFQIQNKTPFTFTIKQYFLHIHYGAMITPNLHNHLFTFNEQRILEKKILTHRNTSKFL